MAIGWYIIPYKRREGRTHPTRYCAMDDYTLEIIYTYGGAWTESEVAGNVAIVKVRTRPNILNTLDRIPGFIRLPRDRLDDPLAGLPSTQISRLRDFLLNAGYTLDEIHEEFGDGLENHTLRDYLHFWARRRLKPRYNPVDDTIYLDGEAQSCRTVESVDEEVTE